MIYTVKRIDEDLDFGCEERAADAPVMALVTIVDESGAEDVIRMEDALLYERGIDEGMRVYFDEEEKLEKALDEDWTKNCSRKNVDTTSFVKMMSEAKAGKEVNWKCPFCGGKVGLMQQEKEHTVIGCDSCDMRINIGEF